MTKTRTDIVALAFQHLGINAAGEVPDATENNYADTVFDGVVGELTDTQGLTMPDDLDLIPDALYLPLSYLLASEIAAHYEIPAPISRSAAIGRVRAALLTDDRENSADLDEDGTVTEAEQDAADRALYY